MTWVVAGLAAVPSCVLWARLSRRLPRSVLLAAALALQAVGMVLPAVSASLGAALAGAVLFGGTFMGITTLALAEGRAYGSPRAVAVLSVGYSVGQIAGPLLVSPFLDSGYRLPLLIGAGLAAAGAVLAALVRPVSSPVRPVSSPVRRG